MHRRAGATATAVVLASLVAVAVPTAGAADADDPRAKKRQVDAQVRSLDAQVDRTAARVKAAADSLERAEAQLPKARLALSQARANARDAQAAAATAAEQIAYTRAEMLHNARRQDAIATDVVSRRATIAAMAVAAYKGGAGGDFARLGLAFGARTPEELTSSMAYLQSVNRAQRSALDGLAEAERDLDAARATLVTLEQRDEEQRAAAAEAVTRAGRAVVDAASAQTAVTELVDDRTDALAEARKLKAIVERKLAEQEAESRRLARIIAARIAAARRAAGNLPSLGGLLSLPVIGPVTSSYGMRYHPILRRTKLHTGTDFGVPTGTAIRAAADGEVLQVVWNTAYGRRVVLDHGQLGGTYLVTTYNHMSRWAVRSGQKVKRGQIIGYVGTTGWSTGPHLHFEVLSNGRFVNPMTKLKR